MNSVLDTPASEDSSAPQAVGQLRQTKPEQRSPGVDEDVDSPQIPAPGLASQLQIDVAVNTEFVAGAEFGGTKVDSSKSRFVFEIGGPVSRVTSLGAQVGLGVRGFSFDGDGQFIDAGKSSGEPFSELFDYSLTLGARIRMLDGLDLELSGRGISRIEEGAEFTSGLEGAGSVSFLGRYKDRVVLRLGVVLRSNFADSSVNVSPVFRLRVRLHDRLWAETGGRSGRLEFDLAENVRIDLFGGIEGGRYRLKDRRDGPGGVGKGSVRLKQTGVGLATRLTFWKIFRVQLEAGVVLTQSIEIQNDDGDFVDQRENRDPAFRGRIALKWRF